MKTLKFPERFLWGASVSTYQVSGCGDTNWSEWEKSPARLVELEKSGDLEKYGLKNFICEEGCFHRSNEGEDHNLIRELGHNAFHFGAEPALIMPEKGIRSNFELYCLRDDTSTCKQVVGKGCLTVVDVCHNTDVPNVLRILHELSYALNRFFAAGHEMTSKKDI